MRANEIVSRVVRDLDDGGKLLWIPDSKTEPGRTRSRIEHDDDDPNIGFKPTYEEKNLSNFVEMNGIEPSAS